MMMMTNFILTICWLFLSMTGNDNVMDLQGKTYTVSDGDVSLFDGREVKNGTLVISEGSYLLRVEKEGDACLKIGDNTELIVNGTLKLAPNDFKRYDMIRIVGNKVKIHGKGCLIGDKFTHTGKEGEWGIGIHFCGASNATLNGLSIKNCWGDCIYVGKQSRKIIIKNCRLDHGRRQGISITSADSVIIKNCTISNVSGTNPQYAIDIEPNKWCTVDNVLIKNVTVTDCEGGIRAIIGKKGVGNARIGKVEIRDCHVMAKSRHTIHFAGCEQAVVEDCVIETRMGEKPILSRKVGRLSEKNNKVICK